MSTVESMPTRALRVLIVEDEPRLRDLLVDVLPEMGFAATGTRTAEEAARVMDTEPRDIVMLDLQLPMMGGMDFFEQLKTRWPRTQVIVLTGFGNLESARRAIHLDVVDFLSKPCPLREIELALERARRRIHSTERDQGSAPAAEDHPGGGVTLWETERRQIVEAIERHNGNRTAAALELGISRRTLHYRLKEYRRLGLPVDAGK